jgi:DNA invertase Pin-like site-specific DNA recombinase
MTLGVLYGRYSSHGQNDASIEQQFDECRKYCEQNDIQIVAEYSDRAKTGTNDNRKDFQRMIRDSAKQAWQIVVVWKVDRFGRNRYEIANNKYKLKKNGVRVLYAKESIPDGPEGILLESVLEGSAEYYSANLAQNVRRGMAANAAELKINGALPLGYRKGADSRYEIDPKAASIVKGIFEDYAAGVPPTDIALRLNARGVHTSSGAKWGRNSFRTLIGNERYTGVYIYGDTRIEGGIPAIIDRDTWEKANAKIAKRKRQPGRGRQVDYALTGKLYCGICGETIVGGVATSRTGDPYYYYNCTGRKVKKSGCLKNSVRKEWLETLVYEAVKEEILTDVTIAHIADACEKAQLAEQEEPEIKDIETRLREVDRKIENLIDAIEKNGADDDIETRLAERKKERLYLKERALDVRGGEIIPKDAIIFWLEKMRGLALSAPQTQGLLADIFIQKIYLYDNEIRIACRITSGESIEISKTFVDDIGTEKGDKTCFALSPSG